MAHIELRPATPGPAVLLVLLLLVPHVPAQADPGDARQRGLERLREMASHLAETERSVFSFDVVYRVNGKGTRMKYETSYEAAFERPNRVALLQTGGMPIASIFSDGERQITHLHELVAHLEAPAPNDAADVLHAEDYPHPPFWRMLAAPGLHALLTNDPHGLVASVQHAVTDFDTERVNGVLAHRIVVDTGEHETRIWIPSEGSPVPIKIQEFQTAAYDPMWGRSESTLTTRITDWRAPESFDAEVFAFDPEEPSYRADDFTSARYGLVDRGDEPRPRRDDRGNDLVGEPAPDFTLELLGGGEFTLSEAIKQHDAVVLDFWATWCPPCVEGLPVLTELTGQHGDRVGFYAVNVRENAGTIEQFLERHELSLAVPLDRDGSVGNQYGVRGIPQTVIIGGDGVVRNVHVGFAMHMRPELESQIRAAVEGEPLSAIDDAKPEAQPADAPAADLHAEQASRLWRLRGTWRGVAFDHDEQLSVALDHRRFARIAADGDVDGTTAMTSRGDTLRLARLNADAPKSYVTFGTWSAPAVGFARDGRVLWQIPQETGVNDVWPADITGDGRDEIIVGYNGGTGVHLYDAEGRLLWENRGIGNVWHVTAADLDGDGSLSPVTTSAMGMIHVFSRDGEHLRTIPRPFYTNRVRPIPTAEGEPDDLFISGRHGHDQRQPDGILHAARLGPDGETRWTLALPEGRHLNDVSIAGSRPWAAVCTQRGQIYVIDLEEGKVIATSNQAGLLQLAWHERDGLDPVLIGASRAGLTAYEIPPVTQD